VICIFDSTWKHLKIVAKSNNSGPEKTKLGQITHLAPEWSRPFAWCAQYDLHSRGESPPWTVMTGTIRLGKGARREAGSEESRRRNRGFDVQKPDRRPLQGWITRPGTGKSNLSFRSCGVDPASLREEGKSYLRRSPFWSVHTGLPRQQCRGTGAEKSAEAVVAQPGEGPNL